MTATCIFCKILNGDIPSYKVYSDSNVYAFLDIAPVTLGHTLVIPRNHYENIFAMPDHESEALVRAMKIIGLALQEATKSTGINILQNNGSSAGQMVFHTHWHLIPRNENDGLNHWSPDANITKDAMEHLAHIVLNKLS